MAGIIVEIFFWLFIIYLIGCIIFGAYAYEMVERFDVPYKETELEKKTKSIKQRYTECLLRLS
jgi:hypothetical protein